MNFDILYSIAIDLINKKDSIMVNDTDCVCVLITQNNSIFTGVSGNAIQNGKLVSLCAEYETIKIMLNSNETKINALVVVNYKTLLPCVPCDDCKKLILEVDSENASTLIMQPDKSFIKLSALLNSSKPLDAFDQSIWESGWDDNDSFNATNNTNPFSNIQTTPSTVNSIPNVVNSNQFNNSMGFNPIPQPMINRNNSMSSIYQPNSKYISSNINNSVYMDSINSVSTLQTATIEKSNSTFAQQQPNVENNRFKERLKNIMGTEDVTSSNNTNSSNSFSQNLENIPKPNINKDIPSKKELKALAKERKKQAKKNIKIMQSIEKHSRT